MLRHQRLNDAMRRLPGRSIRFCCRVVVVFALSACDPPQRVEWKLLGTEFANAWKKAGIENEGSFSILHGELRLEPGQPMTGARFAGWETHDMPRSHYAIEYEAMRVEGDDFFASVTFPVNDTHVSLIVGGWGGAVVGISSIDDMDANENNTRGNGVFENNVWHKVRMEVRDDDLRAWIDSKLFVNVSTKGHTLGLRPGDIEKCVPFGFSSYMTRARIRDVVIRKL